MKRTLVSALEWGFGHTTRVIPVIKELVDNGDEVIIGASRRQATIFREFFPNVKIIELSSVAPIYSESSSQLFSMAFFLPKFLYSIIKEHISLKKIIQQYAIAKVVSDNRYGLYNRSVHSIFICHQLNILLPSKIKFFQAIVNRLNCRAINRFNECWVPDNEPGNSLSGELSNPKYKLFIPTVYKGLLSRFSLIESEDVPYIPKLLVIISGPEKQRTVFENKIISAIEKLTDPIDYLIIRGLPLEERCPKPNAINYCKVGQLKTYIQKSKYIICRSGYSSIMDLAYLRRTAMLVPTPGQTEQEYLAEYLAAGKQFLMTKQNEIDIKEIINLL